jgi:hypothetical protein
MHIVCYVGGTCGDLVSALIDSRDVTFRGTTVKHVDQRTRLKKPHLFGSDSEKDQYLSQVSYHSISSHDLDYHAQRGHDFIGVTVQDWFTALWAADRFHKLHAPHVWQEMQKYCGALTVEDYAQTMIDFSNLLATKTHQLVTLESILAGTIVESLESLISRPVDREFYQLWQTKQCL